MAAFVPLIAAGIAAATTIYATEASRGRGGKAPAFSGGGGGKKNVQTPDVFGSQEMSQGMLGGSGQRPVASLAQSLGAGTPPPKFGPAAGPGQTDDELMRERLRQLAAIGG